MAEAEIAFTPDTEENKGIDFQPDKGREGGGTTLGQKLAVGAGTAIRLAGGIAQSIPSVVEAIPTPLTTGAGAATGAAILGGTDLLAQAIEKLGGVRKDFSLKEAGVSAGVGAIPFGGLAKIARLGWVARAGIGAGISAGATEATSLLETGKFAPQKELAESGLIGAGFTAGAEGLLRAAPRLLRLGETIPMGKQGPKIEAEKAAEEVKEPSATEERKVEKGVPTERERDDTRGTPAETSGRGGIRAAEEIPTQEVTVAGVPFTGANVQEALANAHQATVPEMSPAEFIATGRATDPDFAKGIDPAELDKYAAGDAGKPAAAGTPEQVGVLGEGALPEPAEPQEPTGALPAAKGKAARGRFDSFGSEVAPVSQHIIDDVGGLMSKSTAKRLGLYEKNKDLWDGAPALSHPTHNKIYNTKGGETPDNAAQSLYDAGLIKDPTSSAMWEALDKESKGARSLAEQERAQAKIEKEGERPSEEQKETDDDQREKGQGQTDVLGQIAPVAGEKPPPLPEQPVGGIKGVLRGIKQAVTGQRAGIEPGEGATPTELLDYGRAELKAGHDPEPYFQEAEQGNPLRSDQMAIAGAKIEQLQQATDFARDNLRKDPTNPDLQKAVYDAEAAEKRATERLKPAQTDWGKAGQIQQFGSEVNAASPSGLRRLAQQINQRDVTETEMAGIDKQAAKVQKTVDAEKAARKKFGDQVGEFTKVTKLQTKEELADHFANRLKGLLPCKT